MPHSDKDKQKEASRKHYLANKEAVKARARQAQIAARDRLRQMKEESPCVDCGQFYPFYVMQYDHIGDDKVMNVNRLVKCAGWDKVLAEIAKCELVCANCHAGRSFQRLGLEL